MHNYYEALKNSNRALEIYQNTTQNVDTDRGEVVTLNNIGWCHLDLHNQGRLEMKAKKVAAYPGIICLFLLFLLLIFLFWIVLELLW